MARKAKSSTVQLPKGFKPIRGIGGTWNPAPGDTLQGIIQRFGDNPSKFKKGEVQRYADIDTADGSMRVYESAGTRPLFDLKKGRKVFIAFNGLKKISGRKKPMKDFLVAAG